MVPSAGGSDMPIVQHAGHRNFEKLLRAAYVSSSIRHAAPSESDDDRRGVERHRLEQFRRPFVRDQRRDHARHARRRAREFEAIFERDRKECVELELEPGGRGRWHRLKDNALYLFNEFCLEGNAAC